MADYQTFDDLFTQVSRAIKDYQESQENLVKMIINMVYLNEILQADNLYPLFWLTDFDDSVDTTAPATVSGLSRAAQAIVTTADDHTFAVGDLVTVHNCVGMTEINDKIGQVVAVPDTTHITLSINSSGFSVWTSGGTVHHRGATLDIAGKPVQQLLWASWHDEGKIEKIIPPEFEEDVGNYHYTDTTGRPTRFYHGKSFTGTGVEVNQIIWHPGCDQAYGLRYWFEVRPSRLVNAADVPLLPPVFHDTIISGAITRLAENNVQVESAVIWPGIYRAQLDAIKTFNRKHWKNDRPLEAPYLL